MTTHWKFFAGAALTVSFLLVAVTAQRWGETSALSSRQTTAAEAPVLDYEPELAGEKSKERKGKNRRFNGRGTPAKDKPIAELPAGVEPLPTNTHWWVGLPALPVAASDVIVLGEIVERRAHLSGDKTGIYSEFAVRVDEVLKDATGALDASALLHVNRVGGGVRFASGKVQRYSIARQAMPRQGGQYVLFLRKAADADDLLILTGYEISGGRVTPLDGEDSRDPRNALPFARYRDADSAVFLSELRAAVQNTDAGGIK